MRMATVWEIAPGPGLSAQGGGSQPKTRVTVGERARQLASLDSESRASRLDWTIFCVGASIACLERFSFFFCYCAVSAER